MFNSCAILEKGLFLLLCDSIESGCDKAFQILPLTGMRQKRSTNATNASKHGVPFKHTK